MAEIILENRNKEEADFLLEKASDLMQSSIQGRKNFRYVINNICNVYCKPVREYNPYKDQEEYNYNKYTIKISSNFYTELTLINKFAE